MNNFFDKLGIDLGILVIMLMVLVLVLIVIVLNMSLSQHRLNRKYTMFMKGADGQSLEKMFAKKMKEVDHLSASNEENSIKLHALQKQLGKTLTKYGIVKYDAFDDVGGKLSFALAMLDNKNTGFILNAIHSRDNCFFYIKEIVNGESYILLSDEEKEVLEQAKNVRNYMLT